MTYLMRDHVNVVDNVIKGGKTDHGDVKVQKLGQTVCGMYF